MKYQDYSIKLGFNNDVWKIDDLEILKHFIIEKKAKKLTVIEIKDNNILLELQT